MATAAERQAYDDIIRAYEERLTTAGQHKGQMKTVIERLRETKYYLVHHGNMRNFKNATGDHIGPESAFALLENLHPLEKTAKATLKKQVWNFKTPVKLKKALPSPQREISGLDMSSLLHRVEEGTPIHQSIAQKVRKTESVMRGTLVSLLRNDEEAKHQAVINIENVTQVMKEPTSVGSMRSPIVSTGATNAAQITPSRAAAPLVATLTPLKPVVRSDDSADSPFQLSPDSDSDSEIAKAARKRVRELVDLELTMPTINQKRIEAEMLEAQIFVSPDLEQLQRNEEKTNDSSILIDANDRVAPPIPSEAAQQHVSSRMASPDASTMFVTPKSTETTARYASSSMRESGGFIRMQPLQEDSPAERIKVERARPVKRVKRSRPHHERIGEMTRNDDSDEEMLYENSFYNHQ